MDELLKPCKVKYAKGRNLDTSILLQIRLEFKAKGNISCLLCWIIAIYSANCKLKYNLIRQSVGYVHVKEGTIPQPESKPVPRVLVLALQQKIPRGKS